MLLNCSLLLDEKTWTQKYVKKFVVFRKILGLYFTVSSWVVPSRSPVVRSYSPQLFVPCSVQPRCTKYRPVTTSPVIYTSIKATERKWTECSYCSLKKLRVQSVKANLFCCIWGLTVEKCPPVPNFENENKKIFLSSANCIGLETIA